MTSQSAMHKQTSCDSFVQCTINMNSDYKEMFNIT